MQTFSDQQQSVVEVVADFLSRITVLKNGLKANKSLHKIIYIAHRYFDTLQNELGSDTVILIICRIFCCYGRSFIVHLIYLIDTVIRRTSLHPMNGFI